MNEPVNPYQPPEASDAQRADYKFVCPSCQKQLPFFWLWFSQPFGRCLSCKQRLVVRRHGIHKAWTPLLFSTFCAGTILSFLLFGDVGLLAAPLLLIACASTDGVIAYKIGYFDRPRWLI